MQNTKINDLVEKIKQAKENYYNGISNVPDILYDSWISELLELDPKNVELTNIGSEPISNWAKFKHKIEMGSLNKCQTNEEYLKWHNKYIDENDEVFLTLKLDGLSVSLIYENGVLLHAATRGSGIAGELITQNVVKMIGVPLRLKDKLDLTVRGEILLSKENHNKYFPEYSNARNAASGISRRYDGVGCDKLTILSYQIFSDNLSFSTQKEQFNLLYKLGFIVPPYFQFKTSKEVCDMKYKYQKLLRNKFDFELDGLVAHNNNLSKQALYGILNGRPYASIAFKFDNECRQSVIRDITWQVGNLGRITPVATVDPVQLVGATVTRASIYNYSYIQELKLDIGATVLVARANDVIPRIEELVQGTGSIAAYPTHCPECNTITKFDGESLICTNTLTCPSQVKGRIKNWIQELNLLEWGDSLVDKLVESGKVSNVADLYTLKQSDIANLDRLGDKTAKKCLDILWANSTIPLEVFLGALSIPLIGQSSIKLIMKAGCDTLEKFGQLNATAFEQVPGMGPRRAQSLADGLKANQQLILDILKNGVKIKDIIDGKLTGKSFAITGTLSIKRAEVEKLIIDNGGEIKSSVGKGLNYLIIADPQSSSSKAQAARKLGTVLIDETQFLNLIN